MNKADKTYYVRWFRRLFVAFWLYFGLKAAFQLPSAFYGRHFDWDRESLIRDWDTVRVVAFSKQNLTLRPAPALDPQWTYKLINGQGEAFYFRYAYSKPQGDKIKLYGVLWLKGMPKGKQGVFRLRAMDIPLKKNRSGIPEAYMAGSAETASDFWAAQRRQAYEQGLLRFKGPRKDVYNQAYVRLDSKDFARQLVRFADTVSPAGFYLIVWPREVSVPGGHETSLLDSALTALARKDPERIIIFTPAESVPRDSLIEGVPIHWQPVSPAADERNSFSWKKILAGK